MSVFWIFQNDSGKIFHANSRGTYIWLEKPPLRSGILVELMLGSTTSMGRPELVDFKDGVPFLVAGGLGDSSLGVSIQRKVRTLSEPDDNKCFLRLAFRGAETPCSFS